MTVMYQAAKLNTSMEIKEVDLPSSLNEKDIRNRYISSGVLLGLNSYFFRVRGARSSEEVVYDLDIIVVGLEELQVESLRSKQCREDFVSTSCP